MPPDVSRGLPPEEAKLMMHPEMVKLREEAAKKQAELAEGDSRIETIDSELKVNQNVLLKQLLGTPKPPGGLPACSTPQQVTPPTGAPPGQTLAPSVTPPQSVVPGFLNTPTATPGGLGEVRLQTKRVSRVLSFSW